NTLVSARPTPRIKMGLVAYRDRGDAYVTKRTELTSDLDAVYRELMDYAADGGGDTPESVNQALNEAVTLMQWSREAKTYRVIFLVGDCPPHMNYAEDVKYPVTCEAAARAGIIINTIQCGGHADTVPVWTEIALKAEGRYFRVEQSGSAILASTPFDAELAKLGKELNETRFFYGTKEERKVLNRSLDVAAAIESGASTEAKARRADFLAKPAGEATLSARQELIGDVTGGRTTLTDLETDRLPDVMQKMSPAQREAFVKENIAKRKRIQGQINELAAKRQANIEEQLKKRADGGKASLSHQLYEAVKDQAGKKGIAYTDGPAH
ncbi:MAG TPA: VWA domain-containing protein, partial [Planctomycetota bacterium]|nr:VWA domain-containing protein [Planctomycetota bacterium]